MTPHVPAYRSDGRRRAGHVRGASRGSAAFRSGRICYIAFAVAFGGGTLRDLLLDRHPVFWIENDHLVWIVMAIAVAGSIFPNVIARLEPVLWIPDALGLGLFSILGATYALDGGTGRLVACLMGVLTGSCGGVIADVTCNELPLVFRRSPLYATCSFCGAATFVALRELGVGNSLAMGIGVSVVVALRVGAVRWNWQLPTKPTSEEPGI